MGEMNEILTVKLHNGATVLAKLYKGSPSAMTFANRTQADRRCAIIGDVWFVSKFGGRPFFVVQNPIVTV